MKRKHAQLRVTGSSDGSAPPSPISTGAMDSLLEKLRAAAPQTRDQRDRRRRARLQNRHQVRVASGQKIPDPDEIPEIEESLKYPESISSDGLISPEIQVGDGGDDIADRAALLLQGMRGTDGAADDGEASEKRDSMRRARRRDNADEERKTRRRRREKASSTAGSLGGEGGEEEVPDTPVIEEQGEHEEEGKVVVSPPSPEGSEKRPIELDD